MAFNEPFSLKNNNSQLHRMDYAFQVSDLLANSEKVAFFIMILGVGVFMKIICNKIHILGSLYSPLMLLVGFFGGLIIWLSPKSDIFSFHHLEANNATVYLLIFFPVMLFHTAFSVDYHGFGHATFQVVLVSIVGYPIHVALLTFLFHAALGLHNKWTWEVAIVFSIICCILESDIVFEELNKTQARVKHLQLLLQGEQLAVLAVATYCYAVTFEFYFGTHESNIFILLMVLWQVLGIVVGMVLGYLFDYIFVHVSTDYLPVALIITIFAAFSSFFIGHILVNRAGVITTIATGIILSPTKIKTVPHVEVNITYFWNWLSYIFKTVSFVIPGVIVGLDPVYVRYEHAIYIIIAYIISCCTRCILYVIARPMLNRIGHFLSWGNIAIIVIGPYRGASPLIISMLYRQYSPENGQQILTYMTMLSFLSTIFNSLSLPALLNLLGMYDLTHARAINMRNAIQHVREYRNKAICSLKIDGSLADANWPVVYQATQLATAELNVRQLQGVSEVKYPDMFARQVIMEENVSVSDYGVQRDRDLEIEARQRILNVQLVSLWKQYDNGTLAKKSMRSLASLLQSVADRKDPKLYIEELKLTWAPPKFTKKVKKLLSSILLHLHQSYELQSKEKWRKILLATINHMAYRLTILIMLLIDTFFIFYFILFHNLAPAILLSPNSLQIIDACFFTIFICEIILLIVVLGFDVYFSKRLNQVDFVCNFIVRPVDLMKDHVIFTDLQHVENISLNMTNFALLIRLNRLYIVFEVLLVRLLHILENRMDTILFQRYDIGKAFLVANDQTLKYLRQIVQDKKIFLKLRKEIEEDRKKISKSLGIIQKERPNVAVTIKTRHAIKQVMNEMNDSIMDIYDEGLLDDIEKKYLINSINKAKMGLSLDLISPCSPEYILKDVPWLLGEEDTAAFLLEHARLHSFSFEDIIIDVGDDPSGIFILVSGLVKCIYKPCRSTVDNLNKDGVLPNCDFLVSLKLEEPQEDYIVCGNVIGEIGAVTGRRFDMIVICESEVQVYYIPRYCMFKVLFEMEDCARVLSKVWKSIGIKIALLILQYKPSFQGWLREKTLLYLERSFVPNLMGIEELYLNDLVTDVILIEGKIKDENSDTIYLAPFHIPRSVIKLVLPGSKKWKESFSYDTRLLIIPSKYVTEAEIMSPTGILRDVYIDSVVDVRPSDDLLDTSIHSNKSRKRHRYIDGRFSVLTDPRQ